MGEEGVERVVPFLPAKSTIERRFQPPAVVVEHTIPVEHMHLGDPRRLDEGRLGADADRGGAARPVRQRRHPGVDPVPRQHGPAEIEIRGRNADRAAALVAANHGPDQNVRSTEHAARVLDPTEIEQSTNDRTPGGHVEPVDQANPFLVGDDDREPAIHTESPEGLDRAGPAAAESEVRPFDHHRDRIPQAPQKIVDERVGFEVQKFRRGRQFHHLVGAGLEQSATPFGGGQDPG